ncbi:MAG: transglutaminase domain-containing protein [Hadesarchaea archaeon]|nr:transglutaminase domain-containing protein [Hadesarchaea archaeon]
MSKKIWIISIALMFIIVASIPSIAASEPSESVIYRLKKTYTIKNIGSNQALGENVSFYLIENSDVFGQKILNEEISVEGSYKEILINETSDNKRAKVIGLEPLSPGEEKKIEVTSLLEISSIPKTNPHETEGSIPPSIQKEFTGPVEGVWHTEYEEIKSKAIQLTENESNYWNKAKNIFDFVQKHLDYKLQNIAQGDIWAFVNNEGDCSEYANLFISLARSAGIPAKFAAGYLYSLEENQTSATGFGDFGHAFSLIYLPNVGWVPVDPTESVAGGGGYFAELPINHILELTSNGSNLSVGTPSEVPGARVFWTQYAGEETEVKFEETGVSILPVLAVKPTIYADDLIDDNIWEFSVEVKNEGTRDVSDVSVRLEADDEYFNVPPSEDIGDLGKGIHKYAYFDVGVKKNVENSTISAIVEYDSNEYGSFKSTEETKVSAQLSSPSFETPFEINLENLIIILIIIGCIGGIAIAVKSR